MVLGFSCSVKSFNRTDSKSQIYPSILQTTGVGFMSGFLSSLFALHVGTSLGISKLAHCSWIISCSSLWYMVVCHRTGSRAKCKCSKFRTIHSLMSLCRSLLPLSLCLWSNHWHNHINLFSDPLPLLLVFPRFWRGTRRQLGHFL